MSRRGWSHVVVVLVALAAALYAALLPGGRAPLAEVSLPEAPTQEVAGVTVIAEPSLPQAPAAPAAATSATIGAAAEMAPAERAPTLAKALEESARVNALGNPEAPPPQPPCLPSSSPAYCIYTVREGDTLSEIAHRFALGGGEVPGWELLAASNRPDITSVDDFILPGQNLRVPTTRGVVHATILGETVGDLATVFDVTSADIIRVNSLGTGDLVGIGQILVIPEPKRTAAPPAPAANGAPSSAGAAQPAGRSSAFIWPLRTSIKVTNYMTPRHPLGIDMGLSHDPTATVHAVAAGVVSFGGGDRCCSYGLYVIVDHGGGLQTLYAHLSRLDVAKGQRVSQGQVLGPAGNTGYSFGVHLHFEVHVNGKGVDPMRYLP